MMSRGKTKIEKVLEDRLKEEPLRGEKDKSYNLRDEVGNYIYFLSPIASRDEDYQRLVKRLSHMEEVDHLTSDSTYPKMFDYLPRSVKRGAIKLFNYVKRKPTGVMLKESEANIIKNVLGKKLPSELKEEDACICIHGSLSPHQGGERTNKFGEAEPLKSDQFYVSDVDIAIIGEKAFNYIDQTTHGEAIRPDGELKHNATFRFSLNKYLTKRERKQRQGYDMPSWIHGVLEELNKRKFAGRRHRPINIIFYRNKNVLKKE